MSSSLNNYAKILSSLNNISNTTDVTDNISNIDKTPASISYQTCQACRDDFEEDTLVSMPCDHYWCQDCISRACKNVRNDRDLPMRCGDKCEILEYLALEALPQEEAKVFAKKLRELDTPTRERYYCGNRDCGEFIPGVSKKFMSRVSEQTGAHAVCGSCGSSTCKLCRDLQHEGDCAGPSKEDEQALALIKKKGYQKCSECSRVIERNQGCSHMSCYCGYEFCYHCGGPIGTCNGCGHLEPDVFLRQPQQMIATGLQSLTIVTRPESPRGLTAWFMRNPRMAEVIATAFQSLTTLPRPDSPQNLTIWFMHELHLEGFPGRTGFFLDDFTMVLALNAEARPSREEMDVSDGMLFSLIPEDQDDEEEGEEYDEEAEYDM
jgi:hypothetical protein